MYIMTIQYYNVTGGSSNCYSHGQNTDYYADALIMGDSRGTQAFFV